MPLSDNDKPCGSLNTHEAFDYCDRIIDVDESKLVLAFNAPPFSENRKNNIIIWSVSLIGILCVCCATLLMPTWDPDPWYFSVPVLLVCWVFFVLSTLWRTKIIIAKDTDGIYRERENILTGRKTEKRIMYFVAIIGYFLKDAKYPDPMTAIKLESRKGTKFLWNAPSRELAEKVVAKIEEIKNASK